MLFDNLFTLNGFLGYKRSSFLKADLYSVPFAFSHSLLNTLVQVADLFCTLELVCLKDDHGIMSKSENDFFGSML